MDVIIASSCCPSVLYRFQMITVFGPSLSSSLSLCLSLFPLNMFLSSCAFLPLHLNIPSSSPPVFQLLCFHLSPPLTLSLSLSVLPSLCSLNPFCTFFNSLHPSTPPSSHNHIPSALLMCFTGSQLTTSHTRDPLSPPKQPLMCPLLSFSLYHCLSSFHGHHPCAPP